LWFLVLLQAQALVWEVQQVQVPFLLQAQALVRVVQQ